MNTAIILAAGRGTRMNSNINKQYLKINDKELIAYTLETFNSSADIHEIIVVVNSDEVDYFKNNIINKYSFSKIVSVIEGGSERQYSVWNALAQISSTTEYVLIHDGARPFVSREMIHSAISSAHKYKTVTTAVPVKDTIKVVDALGFSDTTPDRNTLWAIQTPQVFQKDILIRAHKTAIAENFIGTDDASLVERLDIPTKLIMGSYNNIKITTQEDLGFAQVILSNKI